MKLKLSIVFIILSFWSNALIAQQLQITVKNERVVFHQWNASTNNLAVFLVDSNDTILINGSFKKVDEDLVFSPEFPLLDKVAYRLKAGNEIIDFSLKAKINTIPSVTSVYPTADMLPENLLRMYIQFATPMKTVGNLEKIRLINENEQEVKGAIFNNVYELWDDSQTQLTIIFDPSRVKTGLVANETLGRALQTNKRYKIVIGDVEDIYGQKLAQPYIKSFSVVTADMVSPDTNSWQYVLPKANSKSALAIHFLDAVDKMSLLYRIQVFNAQNKLITGSIHIKNKEKTWEFIPDNKWLSKDYVLKVNSRLADPSGNNLNGLFDHSIGSLKNEQEGKIIEIPFQVR